MTESDLLLRQIHPSFIQSGRVTSQAFRPTPKDEGKLSAYDGNMIEPQPAWQHYSEVLKKASVGVMAVSRDECTALNLSIEPNPTPFPEHMLIDFRAFDKKVVEAMAKQLRRHAEVRGWLFLAANAHPPHEQSGSAS